MGTVHQLVAPYQPPTPPQLTCLTEDFAKRLHAFNCMTRALHEVGIRTKALMQADNRIFIAAEDSDLLRSRFFQELRGVRWKTFGSATHNIVTIRGVDVAWLTPLKEQDQ
ncbi:hypothetical protein D9M68_437550 [compost metagenome]